MNEFKQIAEDVVFGMLKQGTEVKPVILLLDKAENRLIYLDVDFGNDENAKEQFLNFVLPELVKAFNLDEYFFISSGWFIERADGEYNGTKPSENKDRKSCVIMLKCKKQEMNFVLQEYEMIDGKTIFGKRNDNSDIASLYTKWNIWFTQQVNLR